MIVDNGTTILDGDETTITTEPDDINTATKSAEEALEDESAIWLRHYGFLHIMCRWHEAVSLVLL